MIKKEIRKIGTREASEKNLSQIEHIKLNTENKLKILKKQTQEEERAKRKADEERKNVQNKYLEKEKLEKSHNSALVSLNSLFTELSYSSISSYN